jgi:hypothetical protein
VTTLPGLAPPHSLRISAPAWGVDPSTKRMAFAALVPTEPPPGECVMVDGETMLRLRPATSDDYAPTLRWATVSLPEHKAQHVRFAAWAGRIGHFVEACRDEWGSPALIAVEQPFSSSHQTEPVSYMALTCLLVALGLRVPEAEVLVMPPQSWKKKATGVGSTGHGLTQNERRKAEKARLMEWARSVGYLGQSQDEADACGIATAAGVILDAR